MDVAQAPPPAYSHPPLEGVHLYWRRKPRSFGASRSVQTLVCQVRVGWGWGWARAVQLPWSLVGGCASLQGCEGHWGKQGCLTHRWLLVPQTPPTLKEKCGPCMLIYPARVGQRYFLQTLQAHLKILRKFLKGSIYLLEGQFQRCFTSRLFAKNLLEGRVLLIQQEVNPLFSFFFFSRAFEATQNPSFGNLALNASVSCS